MNKYRQISPIILSLMIVLLPLFLSPVLVLAVEGSSSTDQTVQSTDGSTSKDTEKKTNEDSKEGTGSDSLATPDASVETEQNDQTVQQTPPSSERENTQSNESVIGPQMDKSPRLGWGAIKNVKVTLPFKAEFIARFVYPDGTPLTPSDLSIEARVVKQPYYTVGEQWMSTQGSAEILKNTFSIPYKGNGVWGSDFTTSPITYGVEADGLTSNGLGVFYDQVFLQPKASIKKFTVKEGVLTTSKGWYMTYTTSQLPASPAETTQILMKNNPFVRTDPSFPSPYDTKYGFMTKPVLPFNGNYPEFSGHPWTLGSNTAAPFKYTAGAAWNTDGYRYITFWENIRSDLSKYLTYEVEAPQITETFIDQNHNKIPTSDLDNSLIQDNSYYAIQDSYSFGGHGQPASLPLTYIKNGKTYEYKGWFYGDEFKTGVPQFDWKDISDDQKDKYGKIRIMYAEKKNQYKLTGHWVDDSGNHNHLTNISGYVSQNPGSMTVPEGYNFSGNAHASIQENGNGPWWDFIGWEDPIHAPGIVNPGNPVVLNNVDCDTDFYYIYRKRIPRLALELIPSSTVETESGKTIDWTLTINNTGGETLKNIKLSDAFLAASGGNMTAPVNTVIKNNGGTPITGITDAVWTDNGAELASKNVTVLKNQKLTVTFQTTVTGAIHESIDHTVEVDGNIDNPAEVTSNIRIKDSDHHAVTDPTDEKLSLLYAPNKFDFGFNKKKNIGVTQTEKLKASFYNNKTITDGFYVKLQDPRDNQTGNNWKLSASLDYFTNSSSGILSVQPTIELDNLTAGTATDANTGNESFSSTTNTTVASGPITLVGGGGTIPIMNSQNLKNKGTWLVKIPFNDVELHIPPNIGEEGKGYTSELIWTLEDTI